MKGDINDTLRNGGEDAVRARHDGAKRYSPKSPLVIACAADIKPERVKWLLAGSTSHRQVCCGCRLSASRRRHRCLSDALAAANGALRDTWPSAARPRI